VVNSNEYIGPQTVSTMGRNITVNIHSANSGDIKNIQLEAQGYLFSVDANITLRLQDIELRGISENNSSLVLVSQGAILILNSGSKISLNTNRTDPYNAYGGGINVNGGVLEMNEGSEIIGNTVFPAYYRWGGGGGIYVANVVGTSGYGGGIHIEDNGSSFTKRAILGNNTSGIIYGGTGEIANISRNGGDAIYRNFGTRQQRNTTLGYYDEISSLTDAGWEL